MPPYGLHRADLLSEHRTCLELEAYGLSQVLSTLHADPELKARFTTLVVGQVVEADEGTAQSQERLLRVAHLPSTLEHFGAAPIGASVLGAGDRCRNPGDNEQERGAERPFPRSKCDCSGLHLIALWATSRRV